jgi:phasin family protein
MRIVEQLHLARDAFNARTRGYRQEAAAAARQSVARAASRVLAAKRSVRTLAAAGQRLSSLSNRYFERMLGQQAHMVEGIIDDGAERLKRAAHADGLREMLAEQKSTLAASGQRLRKEARAAWKIAADTSRELRGLATETYDQLVHGAKTPRTRRKSAKPHARARARKARTA